MNIMVLNGVLKHAGYSILSASSGPEALSMARVERPDMVLLDVMMPGETGFETCRKLKNDPATAHIPIIFVTCLDQLSNKLAGLSIGAVDYITKPFNAEEVVARVRAHMNFKRVQGAIIDAQASRLEQVNAAQKSLLTPAGITARGQVRGAIPAPCLRLAETSTMSSPWTRGRWPILWPMSAGTILAPPSSPRRSKPCSTSTRHPESPRRTSSQP